MYFYLGIMLPFVLAIVVYFPWLSLNLWKNMKILSIARTRNQSGSSRIA